jgi:hypothetical protein
MLVNERPWSTKIWRVSGSERQIVAAPQVRQEGNSTTIPVVEEILVNLAAARAERQRFNIKSVRTTDVTGRRWHHPFGGRP